VCADYARLMLVSLSHLLVLVAMTVDLVAIPCSFFESSGLCACNLSAGRSPILQCHHVYRLLASSSLFNVVSTEITKHEVAMLLLMSSKELLFTIRLLVILVGYR
jgi:hypothetical protein